MTKRYYHDKVENVFSVSASITAQNTFTEESIFSHEKPFNLSVGGSGWSATVTLQRSFDGGSTWLDVWTTTSPSEEIVDNSEANVLWRVGCKTSEYSSGTIPLRLSQ